MDLISIISTDGQLGVFKRQESSTQTRPHQNFSDYIAWGGNFQT